MNLNYVPTQARSPYMTFAQALGYVKPISWGIVPTNRKIDVQPVNMIQGLPQTWRHEQCIIPVEFHHRIIALYDWDELDLKLLDELEVEKRKRMAKPQNPLIGKVVKKTCSLNGFRITNIFDRWGKTWATFRHDLHGVLYRDISTIRVKDMA